MRLSLVIIDRDSVLLDRRINDCTDLFVHVFCWINIPSQPRRQ